MTEPVGGASGLTNSAGDLLDQAHGLILAAVLAALAGMVDAIGYLRLSHLFVSFMSGNSTQLAAAVGQGNLTDAGIITELITLFVLGAAAGQVLAGFTGRWHVTWVLVAVAVLLAIAAVLAPSPEPMVLAMGALNASMHRDRKDWCQPNLRYRHSGKIRPESGRFPDPALNRMDMAGAGLTMGRTDRRSDNRQRRVHADGGSGNLGSRPASLPPRGLVSNYTGTGLTVEHRGACRSLAPQVATLRNLGVSRGMTEPVAIARCLSSPGDPDFAPYLRRSFARSMGCSTDLFCSR